ncbi:unnamed protein product [Vicia faba]|uniref:Chitinase n=1 Tax=Vicia faba TaxID=3906 RepID=A0AAV0YX07_VICFA|nr:unnamed protein product [Vicia faba]
MSSKMQTLMFLLVLTISSFTVKASPSDAGITIYWGQNLGDGSLSSTCNTGNYKIVLLAFLNVFGAGRTPIWNFAGHCGGSNLYWDDLARHLNNIRQQNSGYGRGRGRGGRDSGRSGRVLFR